MTPDRKAILIFLAISIVALGVAFGYRYQQEKRDISEIKAAQEWARDDADEGISTEPSAPSDCIYDASMLLVDGSEICLTVAHELNGTDGVRFGWDRIVHTFTLIKADGTRRELAKRVEGFNHSDEKQFFEVEGLPFVSYWYPIGVSADEGFAYFTRTQGLPLDGPGTGNRLDLWSLNLETGELHQVLKVGDLLNYWTSAYILDVHIPSELVIVRKGEDVSVLGFDGKTVVKLSKLPFDLKARETLMDNETYLFSENGMQIVVMARREVPYGSGKDVEYGPAVFDIATGKYL
jgi:hypothetical protein